MSKRKHGGLHHRGHQPHSKARAGTNRRCARDLTPEQRAERDRRVADLLRQADDESTSQPPPGTAG